MWFRMGNCLKATEMATDGCEIYELKHPGSCTGMFWRKDPRKEVEAVEQKGNADWPKNGSLLEGVVHEFDTKKWLCVSRWKQAKSSSWINDCQGLWMPFDQGGTLLHKK